MGYGDTTKKLLEHLTRHGLQTSKQLESLPFWPGVRTRISTLVLQGRIQKVEIVNPLSAGKYQRVKVIAIKICEGVNTGPVNRQQNEKSVSSGLRVGHQCQHRE